MNLQHHRTPRRGLSLWLVVALLFMQIATSAYACPGGLLMATMPGPPAALAPADDAGTHAAGAHAADRVAAQHDSAGHTGVPADDSAGHHPGAAAAAMSPDMADCDMSAGLDADAPQLCKLHCEPGNQTPLHASASNDAPPTPLLWAVLDWSATALLPRQGHQPRLGVASGAPPPGAPPLYLSLLVLRN